MTDRRWTPRTLAARALGREDETTHGVVPPLHVATTYIRDADNQYRNGYIYGRPHNATVQHCEAVITALEGAAGTMLFASGTAASVAVVLAMLPGSRIVAPKVMYWSFRHWLANDAAALGYRTVFVENGDAEAFKAAIAAEPTALVWLETPANPTWAVTDIAAVAAACKAAGAVLAVDSTVATPILSRPIAHGADLVVHSATKYMNGHSDTIAGAVAVAETGPLANRIADVRRTHGAILGPFEAFLLMRGLRTLDARVRVQCASALKLAERLQGHGHVAEVLYPGLPGFAGHETAKRQMQGGFSGMLSIRVKGGEPAAIATAARVELWKRATSLGGVESLIEHRASIEGPGTPCPTDLLRLSVGLEDPDDLFADLDRALRGANA